MEQGIFLNRHIDGLEVSQERIFKKDLKTILIADDPRRTRIMRHIKRFLGLNMGNRIHVTFRGKYPDLNIPEPSQNEKEYLSKHNLPFIYSIGSQEVFYQIVLRLYGTRAYFEELEKSGIIEKMNY